MRIHRLSAWCGALLVAALGPGSVQACTSFLLKGNDGGSVYGRTMEFGLPLQSAATLIQRGAKLQGVGPNGIPGSGLNWQTQYAAVGMNALGQPVLVDGLNEKGLAGGLLNAPNSAVYQKVGAGQSSRSIASYQLLTYVLTTCATVEEVKTKLPKILVNQSALGSYGGVVRIHMTVHDRSGKSLAVEYLNGQLVMRDNPTGVFTNDPPFERHLATLGNVANLVPNEPAPLKIGGASFGAVSSGGGMAGLPGDMLSTSRFVRAALLSRYAPTNVSTAQQVAQAFHMLNNFDIPPGMIALAPGSSYGGGASKSSGGFEITEWSVVADQKNLVYYFRTYANPDIRSLDLRSLPLTGGKVRTLPLDQPVRITPLSL